MAIKRLCKDCGQTQAQLGEAIGVDKSYISKIETGKLAFTPSEETLRLIAKETDSNPLELLSLAERTPEELRSTVESEKAREFFEIVRNEQLENEDWHNLTQILRRRIARRGGNR
ncbi:MAG: helix-turn-helix domain-containing protein [Acidobacteria bacterium]|nr:helix-turn-helix domain-containing protein [Acidobacteriota bacterium]